MAKLRRRDPLPGEKESLRRSVEVIKSGLVLSDDEREEIESHVVSLGPEYYIDEYKKTGRYYDIDCPDGIDGLVRDVESGVLNCSL